MKKVLVFASGLMGELTLKYLEQWGRYLTVITSSPDVMRRRNTGNLDFLSSKFSIYESHENKFTSLPNEISDADCIVTVDWTKDYFKDNKPPFPVYHTHPSLLPLYRGYGAISRQFMGGVKVSGLTAYVDSGIIDAGDVVFCKKIKISYGDIPADFINHCAEACAEFIAKLQDGVNFTAVAQDHSKAFYMARTRNSQKVIDFNASAISVYNFIAAYSYPFNGAVFYYKGEKFKAMTALVEKWEGIYGEPGEVIDKSDYGVEVACGDGTVIIKDIEPFRDFESGDMIF